MGIAKPRRPETRRLAHDPRMRRSDGRQETDYGKASMEQCRGCSVPAESESAAHCLQPGPVPCCGKCRGIKVNAPKPSKFSLQRL